MITTESRSTPCGCRTIDECFHNLLAEQKALDDLVDAFSARMKEKLQEQRRRGYWGWDDPQNKEFLKDQLRKHLDKGPGQEVDIANLAAMVWNLSQP